MSELTESTIIMVDDNVDEIFLTRRNMRDEGLINRFVSEKKPAKLFETLDELISSGVPKESFVVLLDINMPKVNGFETLTAIRSHPTYKNVPIFMLTSSDDLLDMLEADDLGCDGYLTKPFSSEIFLTELQKISTLKNKIFFSPDLDRMAVEKTDQDLSLVAS